MSFFLSIKFICTTVKIVENFNVNSPLLLLDGPLNSLMRLCLNYALVGTTC